MTHSHSSLNDFIAHARSKGMDHQTIRMLLLSSGWKEKDVATALSSESLEMAIPVPPDASSARDAFFHLLNFTALYSTVIALIVLFFTYLNRLLPDRVVDYLGYEDGTLSSIRWSLAVVIVSYPLLLWMAKLIAKELQQHPEKAVGGVRRWLTYLTLFVTACTLVGDLITLIFTLLQGELTLRFTLKVLVILGLTGFPFCYYFLSLRGSRWSQKALDRYAFWKSLVIVSIAVVWGLLIVGGPATGRTQRLDEQRISDLRAIQNEVLNIAYGDKRYQPTPVATLPKSLPKTIQEIEAQATYQRLNITDPATSVPYEYRVVQSTSFELCATFDLERQASYDIFWDHPAGRHCYLFDALNSQGK